MARNCHACGYRIVPDTANYCANCGARVEGTVGRTVGDRVFNVIFFFLATAGLLVVGTVGTCFLMILRG
jgi:hypothetical protein